MALPLALLAPPPSLGRHPAPREVRWRQARGQGQHGQPGKRGGFGWGGVRLPVAAGGSCGTDTRVPEPSSPRVPAGACTGRPQRALQGANGTSPDGGLRSACWHGAPARSCVRLSSVSRIACEAMRQSTAWAIVSPCGAPATQTPLVPAPRPMAAALWAPPSNASFLQSQCCSRCWSLVPLRAWDRT